MIPIHCPKCGRRGNIPPDRVNFRLNCKACSAVFHMDPAGQLVLGEPGSKEEKAKRARPAREAVDIDVEALLRKWSKPARIAGAVILALVLLWLYLPTGASGSRILDTSQSVASAVTANDKGKVVALATKGTAEPAGQWFDLLHAQLEKDRVAPNADVLALLQLSGGEREGTATVMSTVATDGSASVPPTVSFTLVLRREDGRWALDGQQTLQEGRGWAAHAEAARSQSSHR
jgi:hypothetical protein